MKTIPIMPGLLLMCSLVQAQTLNPAITTTGSTPVTYVIGQQDANSRVWQKIVQSTDAKGNIAYQTNQAYVELATGLNFWRNGRWNPSQEKIDISSDGKSAAATSGQHQVYFPGDIYDGMIKFITPDGKKLESEPIGLSYSDGNNSVLLAVVTNATGAILPAGNQVIYANAFSGLNADLVYTYTRAGFEQDVILRQQPPDPVSLGLNPKTTRLQVVTEFLKSPPPGIRASSVPTPAGNLEDDSLDFGAMQMGPGRAFSIGMQSESAGVNKRWVLIQGRQFLIEEVPIVSVASAIDSLPPFAQSGRGIRPVVSKNLVLPPPRLVHSSPKSMFVVQAEPPREGLVLDYVTMTTQTNYTFQGDTTYYISGSVALNGTSTFEGGAVIKYTNNAMITFAGGALNWLVGPYRPVMFTAKDDNSAGESISGSTGNPTNNYANPALRILFPTVFNQPISNFRIACAVQAVWLSGSANYFFYDGQIVNCQNGFYGQGSVRGYLRNMLFSGVLTNFDNLQNSTFDVQNATFNSSSNLTTAGNFAFQTMTLKFTNCIFANVMALTNNPSVNSSYQVLGGTNGFYNCPAFGTGQVTNNFYPFLTVGAGNYYLTNGCGFFNVGTTNIDPNLLADLKTRTAYPPVVYSNYTFTTAQTFTPQAQRDTDIPDLGYHYDPIDYFFGGCTASSNITFTAGTASGWFELPGSGGPGYGIALADQVIVAFNGTATAKCIWARYDTVQEGGNGLWQDKGWLGGMTCRYPGNSYSISMAPQIVADFTVCSGMCWDPNHFRDYSTPLILRADNCEFYSATLGGYNNNYYWTNCLVYRMTASQNQGYNPSNAFTMRNCTWHGGLVYFTPDANQIPLSVRDCAFDGTSFTIQNYGLNGDYDYNAFTNNAQRFPVGGSHDVTNFTSFDWQTSWLGNYYLPPGSPLIDKGDVTADTVGLYHFTTQTNQVPETNSIVDIGYHYVATDAAGNPLDTDGDGTPDYLEDANGNGLVDSGENSWTNYNSVNGLTNGNSLLIFTPLK